MIGEDPLIVSNRIQAEYHRVRESTYYKMLQYRHQSIASNYCKEDDIIEGLEKCRKLKEEYLRVQGEILGKP